MDEKYKNLLFKYTKLIEEIKGLKEYYNKGSMCSIAESCWGESVCDDILKIASKLDKEYPSE